MYKVEITDKNKYELELNRANVVIGSGGAVEPVWGTITGDITQQEDLQEELTGIKESIPDFTQVKEDIANLESVKADKSEIPDVTSLATKSELTDGLATKADTSSLLGLATKQELESKVDKVKGYSLIPDTEIDRLSSVTNYNDSAIKEDIDHIKEELTDKADSSSLNGLNEKIDQKANKADVYTKEEVDGKITAIPKPDLSAYSTTVENDKKYQPKGNYLTEIPAEYVTETELASKGYITDISGKADKTDVYTKEEVDDKLTDRVDLSNYYTKQQIDSKGYLTKETDPTVPEWAKEPNKPTYTAAEVGALPSDTKIPDISGLATKEELESKADIESIPSKVSQLDNDAGYITDISGKVDKTELVNYALKTDIPDIDGLATKAELSSKLDSSIYNADKSSFALKTEIPDISNLASKSELPTKTSDLTNDSGYMTSIPIEYITELKSKADKSAISDMLTKTEAKTTYQPIGNYATKAEIPTSLPANGGNADTVNGKTVLSNVPANAKFTDTVYNDSSIRSLIGNKANSADVYTKTVIDDTFMKKSQITFSTSEPTGGSNGDIWFVYK